MLRVCINADNKIQPVSADNTSTKVVRGVSVGNAEDEGVEFVRHIVHTEGTFEGPNENYPSF